MFSMSIKFEIHHIAFFCSLELTGKVSWVAALATINDYFIRDKMQGLIPVIFMNTFNRLMQDFEASGKVSRCQFISHKNSCLTSDDRCYSIFLSPTTVY